MSDVMERPIREQADDKIVIDGEFIKEQASEAVATFFAPFAGVVAAATGDRRIFVRRRRKRARRAA